MAIENAFRRVCQKIIRQTGMQLVRSETLAELRRIERNEAKMRQAIPFIVAMGTGPAQQVLQYLPHSRAQLFQDLFVLCETAFRRGGFFVEFGATDGVYLSNTYLLETELGWKGILAEPAVRWHEALRANRRVAVDYDCVWTSTGQSLEFNETDQIELSTIDLFSEADQHRASRESGNRYQVSTISLEDLLKRHDAPRHINYLSIDTEGSEYDILRTFDFAKYRIDVITVEHNFTPNRSRIHDLLAEQGFTRVHEEVSQFDDWYVRRKNF
jgi:FkbM family methyltransferase